MGDPAVLELAMGLDVGGAETHIVGLCRTLKSHGWTVEVASSGGRRVVDLDGAKVVHHMVPLASRNPFQMLSAYRSLKRLVRERRIELLHAHARIPAWIGSLVAREAGIPLVVTYHWTFVSGPFWNLVTRPGDHTIAVSDDIKDYVVEKFGFAADKVTVIPNGIDCDEFSPATPLETAAARRLHGVDTQGGPVIVYASRMTKELAGTATAAIEAVSRLAEYPGARLLIAGDGEYLEQVKQAASDANAAAATAGEADAEVAGLSGLSGRPKVTCLGFVSDMASLYRASDLVVGMSRVALEGMACGKPAIIAGPEGDYGLVSESNLADLEACNFTARGAPKPTEPETLAGEIRYALDRRSSDTAAFFLDVVRKRHSVEATTVSVEEVYRRVASQHKTV